MSPSQRLAIVVALPDESRRLEALLDDATVHETKSARWTRGRLANRDVVLLRTGIGARRARERTEALLMNERVGALLAIGFGGGLRDCHLNGDVVVAEEVLAPNPPLGEGLESFSSDASLLERSPTEIGALSVVRRGRLLTVNRILRRGGEKRTVGEQESADAVDMESAGVARAARDAGVPALFARVVVDDSECDLPLDFSKLVDGEGRVRARRLTGAILLRPWAITGLLDLRRRSLKAAESLTSFVVRFLEALPSEP